MEKKLLIAFALIISLISCKKEKPIAPEVEERKPEVLIKNITDNLAGADSISTFTNALKTLSLTTEETAEGITVFAPLNENANLNETGSTHSKIDRISSNGNKTGIKPGNAISATNTTATIAITDSVLRDHIVKGVFKLSDLTDGKILTGLSGKQLKITRSADTIWINGVLIGGKQIVSTNNEVVYTVKSVLSATSVTDELQSTSLEITVWDATKWSTAKPKGEVLVNATVVLYHTQQNYADSISAYQGISDATGKVTFKSITPGTYYIKVSADNKSNIFNRSAKQAGMYLGFANAGIFQTSTEVSAAPAQTGAAPGNFKWTDANQDGRIDDNDRVTLPYEKAIVANGTLKKIEVTIGYLNNLQSQGITEQEFLTAFAQAESNIATWHKNLVVLDGLLSHDAILDSIPLALMNAYQGIGNFAFNPSNQVITQTWQQAYQYIGVLNTLQEQAPATLSNRSERLARVHGIRAYLYLQLLTYYGNIPLIRNAADLSNLSNTNQNAVYDYISTELQAAAAALPQTSSSTTELNALSLKALLAKAALFKKDYAKVSDYTDEILNSSRYLLEASNSKFSSGSKEIIWDNSVNMNINIKTYFYNRATLPYIRLSEVYLMNAEANLSLNNIQKAQSDLMTLTQRSGQQMSIPVDINTLRSVWLNEMKREGTSFPALLRWETAAQVLGSSGFSAPKNNHLPIPQVIISQNPNMIQNAGY